MKSLITAVFVCLLASSSIHGSEMANESKIERVITKAPQHILYSHLWVFEYQCAIAGIDFEDFINFMATSPLQWDGDIWRFEMDDYYDDDDNVYDEDVPDWRKEYSDFMLSCIYAYQEGLHQIKNDLLAEIKKALLLSKPKTEKAEKARSKVLEIIHCIETRGLDDNLRHNLVTCVKYFDDWESLNWKNSLVDALYLEELVFEFKLVKQSLNRGSYIPGLY